ncbi:uncharacterized protein FIBRA_07764 [Fibroporia radiculosa]|uniref:Uncharacterized protein n=1 Tax=Fibroporia radiculosa TaxID=599839 RepID=J4GFH3_9APHY|nr:uncharacterized protein FIBRA_07764 [Fibroporia radiculosa]CCM05538.1 predicted protein [Fibroporia radiculosa]
MPQFVYVVHEFTPENPDEVALKVGERIEVVEKDDLYGDGWWQGRNSAGVVGLFPESYTSSIPPNTSSVGATASSANGSSSSSTVDGPTVTQITNPSTGTPSSIRNTADPILSNSTEEISTSDRGTTSNETGGRGSGEMMQATMTDVQKAIEQLGRGGDDGTRSFSFASSHSQSTDHSEAEDTDKEDEDGEEHAFGWSRGARTKLALKAQQANEEREAKERDTSRQELRPSADPTTPMRIVAPPIDVEVSDESDDEEVVRTRRSQSPPQKSSSPRSASLGRVKYSHISEEDEEQEAAGLSSRHSRSASATMNFRRSPPPVITVTEQPLPLRSQGSRDSTANIVPSEEFIVPSPAADESEIPTARAERATFPDAQINPNPVEENEPASPAVQVDEPSPVSETSLAVPPTGGLAALARATSYPPLTRASPLTTQAASASTLSMPQMVTPTPSAIRVSDAPFASPLPSPSASSFAGSMSMGSAGIQQTLTPATSHRNSADAKGAALLDAKKERPEGHPSEWSVEQVIEWLKSKGFDEGVCDKFIEQEITGDVLLELDANVLKTEIGIVAFGKRARIVNAITELRRPSSIFESPSHTPARVMTPRSQTGNSLPYSHSHSASMQSSAPTQASSAWAYSPLYAPSAQGFPSPGVVSMINSEAPHTADLQPKNGWPTSEAETTVTAEEQESGSVEVRKAATMGLGLGLQPSLMNGKDSLPGRLALSPSPSDSAIASTTDVTNGTTAADEERAVMSESDTLPADSKHKKRRFWRSESGSVKAGSTISDSGSRHSKDTGSVPSPPTASTAVSAPVSTAASPTDTKSEPSNESASIVNRRTSKKRESVDGRKPSDRLSLFGTSFSGTLGKGGKSRKPPPRLSSTSEKNEKEKSPEEKHSAFSRIREKKPGGRPSTADGTLREKSQRIPSIREVNESKEKEPKPVKEADKPKDKEDPAVLRKRTASTVGPTKATVVPVSPGKGAPALKPGQSILDQIGTPDHEGWMRKRGDRYNTWKARYCVLKGPHLYILRSKNKTESKIKAYVNIEGYKVCMDEDLDPGRYGFRIIHEGDKTHCFSSEDQIVVREWMKALMKATITRDYSDLVVSSCDIPTIPLAVAQAMNPAPRPPSPTARAATQRAMRAENPHQLSQRDAQVLLMGVQAKDKGGVERARLESFFTNDTISTAGSEPGSPKLATSGKAPPRPSRELRRLTSKSESQGPVDTELIDWANSHLPLALQLSDPAGPIFGGLALLRLAEDIKGKPSSPRVPDSAFPSGPNDEKLDGLFRLFDFLLDNDVKMGTVSINDIRQGKHEKIVQLLRALRAWEDKRKTIARSLGPGAPTNGR